MKLISRPATKREREIDVASRILGNACYVGTCRQSTKKSAKSGG
jgi:hypothetical protein